MVTPASLIPTVSVGKGAAESPAGEASRTATPRRRHAPGKPSDQVENQKPIASVGNITEGIHTSSVGNITEGIKESILLQ